ncbi:MAG TPA: autotransporter-associated beta strand repeat-containing protein [Rariglobus sp.]|nr:autotransporter-associated beta strand repeat-containing protein [Rariglobus sp.]
MSKKKSPFSFLCIGRSVVHSALCAALASVVLVAVPNASAVLWNSASSTGNTYWGASGNWSGTIPNAIGDLAQIPTATSFRVITLADSAGVDASYTVGSFYFGSSGGGSNAYTYLLQNVASGTGRLIFDVSSGNATLQFQDMFASSTQRINTGITLNDNLSINPRSSLGINQINGQISSGSGLTTGIIIASNVVGGTVQLGASNDYTGGTTINGGTLKLITGNDRLPTATTLAVNGAASVAGVFDLNTFNQKVGVLTGGSGTVNGSITNNASGTGTATLTVESTTTHSTFDGIIKNGSTAKVALTKAGAGTSLTLTGANTYTGATTVNGGSLIVNGSLASGSAVSIGASGTLGGSGTVSGTVAVAGTLSPGNSPGLLTTGAQTWSNGGNYNWQVMDATGSIGTGFDSIAITTGGLNLTGLTTGGFNINLWSLSSIGPDVNGNAINFDNSINHTWTLVSNTGDLTSVAGTLFNVNIVATNGTSGFSNNLGGGSFSVVGTSNSLDLVFTAASIPEPSTYAALVGSIALAGSVWCSRKRRA